MVAAAAAAADRRQSGRQSEQERNNYCYCTAALLLLPLPLLLFRWTARGANCCLTGQDRRKVGISAPSSYSISLTRYAPASRQLDRYVARLSTFNFSTIHSSCQFQACIAPPETPCPSSIRPHPGATRPFSSSPSAPSPFLCTHTAPRTRTVATDSIRFPPPISFLLSPRPRSGPQLPVVTCPQTRLFPLHPPTSQRSAGRLSCLQEFVRRRFFSRSGPSQF